MSETTGEPDESSFGLGGESSADADRDAAQGSSPRPDVDESADESVPDSHAADVDAGYDDESDSPTLKDDPQDY